MKNPDDTMRQFNRTLESIHREIDSVNGLARLSIGLALVAILLAILSLNLVRDKPIAEPLAEAWVDIDAPVVLEGK